MDISEQRTSSKEETSSEPVSPSLRCPSEALNPDGHIDPYKLFVLYEQQRNELNKLRESVQRQHKSQKKLESQLAEAQDVLQKRESQVVKLTHKIHDQQVWTVDTDAGRGIATF
ncbi:hypothetical protein SJAG_00454 [Schizosaccharomyces japonicus yFS275]|uniref:Uncharacterized protein n=1 Tax=Schizosaccharomyces japonicus (strain yFS275 / FY16936) TaxID=402676 RepID=B6JVN9_SCHJY|nr:hypothetical protein SJAG_00454 [Schizosaccharomyces japonicus yFS275]EEB05440.1 hypothetical protein SJAG_00454 [Schizosaccharomyces japonicus yFS275]